jgi:hypothetical protein
MKTPGNNITLAGKDLIDGRGLIEYISRAINNSLEKANQNIGFLPF